MDSQRIESVEPILELERYPEFAKGKLIHRNDGSRYISINNYNAEVQLNVRKLERKELISQIKIVKPLIDTGERLHFLRCLHKMRLQLKYANTTPKYILHNIITNSKYKIMKFFFPSITKEIELLDNYYNEQLLRTS